eukprot:5123266-Ditylum_brightwellii.AAC.1
MYPKQYFLFALAISTLENDTISDGKDLARVLYVNFGLMKYRTFENWAKGCRTFVISLAGLVAGCGTLNLIPGG